MDSESPKQSIVLNAGHTDIIAKYYPEIGNNRVVVNSETDKKVLEFPNLTIRRRDPYYGDDDVHKYTMEAELTTEQLRAIFEINPERDVITDKQTDILWGIQQEVATMNSVLYSESSVLATRYEQLKQRPEMMGKKIRRLAELYPNVSKSLSLIDALISELQALDVVAQEHVKGEVEQHGKLIEEKDIELQRLFRENKKEEYKVLSEQKIEFGPNVTFHHFYERLIGEVQVMEVCLELVQELLENPLFTDIEELTPSQEAEQVKVLSKKAGLDQVRIDQIRGEIQKKEDIDLIAGRSYLET